MHRDCLAVWTMRCDPLWAQSPVAGVLYSDAQPLFAVALLGSHSDAQTLHSAVVEVSVFGELPDTGMVACLH